ncbi:hypothetical protein FI667_g7175, partial [Globisporangium splendens]
MNLRLTTFLAGVALAALVTESRAANLRAASPAQRVLEEGDDDTLERAKLIRPTWSPPVQRVLEEGDDEERAKLIIPTWSPPVQRVLEEGDDEGEGEVDQANVEPTGAARAGGG